LKNCETIRSRIITRSVSFEVARISHEVAAARSCGRKPAESETKEVVSREAAAAIGRAQCAAAASRLKIIFRLNSVGFRPRLRAAIASRFRNGATSKSVSEGILYGPSLTLRVTKKMQSIPPLK
jgi:hypothetical protein